jgi:hypothetical protein
MGAVIAAMPDVVAELDASPAQLLVEIGRIATRSLHTSVDPAKNPPPYWR